MVNLYRENRPDSRLRGVLQMQGTRFFDKYHGVLDSIIRLSQDDYGVFSQSLQLEWRQGLAAEFELTPFFRYYRQNAADFSTPRRWMACQSPRRRDSRTNRLTHRRTIASPQWNTMSLGLKARYRLSEHIARPPPTSTMT